MDFKIGQFSFEGPVSGLVLLLFILFGFAITMKFDSDLKSKHNKIWKNLGSPTIFWNNSIQNGVARFWFVVKGEYKLLKDKSLSILGDVLRYSYLIYLLLFIYFSVYSIPN